MKRLLAEYQVISYGRFLKDNRCVVAVNNDDKERELKIPVWEIGIEDEDRMVRVMSTSESGYRTGPAHYYAVDGVLTLKLEKYSSILLISNKRS